ncbi:MAG: o-succinylbenzoate synthase [Ilumatobacteraceae bacterium]|nr:o-succinylbenzoate synthase [Ilumatobacteraceae bacterium]
MIDDLKKINIRSIELRRISLPLVTPFRTSFSTETHRDILLVRVETDDAVGWGECVSGNEPLYSNEYVEGSQQVMIDHLIPRLFAFRSRAMSAHDVAQILRPVKDHRMAKAALEAAILDAQLRENNVSLATHLGSIHELVPSGVSVGIANSLDELVSTVGGYLDEGYARIKLKIEPGWDIEPVRVIRKTFGDQVPLQVDANTAFTREDGPLLAQLDPFNLLLIEQPLPEDDITGHALIARQVKTPICLDESIVSSHVAIDAIERGACSIVNIKAGRVGGYLEAVRIHNVCQQRGVPVWCGGMLETGIGRAMNVALAGLPNFTVTGDISASERFWEQDIVQQPIRLESGQVRLPSGSGAGFEIDGPFLSDVSTSTITLRSEG